MSDTNVIASDVEKVITSIKKEELVQLALDLGNINSPPGREGEVAKYVEDWFKKTIFRPKPMEKKPEPAAGPECSMWRDVNVFNEVGIPSATYRPAAGVGGGNYFTTIDDLLQSARLYAMIMMDICNRDKAAVNQEKKYR